MIIYVSGPYSAPTEAERMNNVMAAIHAGLEVIKRGHVALVPHLSHFLDQTAIFEQDWHIGYEEWLRQDLALLDRCDALLYLAPSPGADRELERAAAAGHRIFCSVAEIPTPLEGQG